MIVPEWAPCISRTHEVSVARGDVPTEAAQPRIQATRLLPRAASASSASLPTAAEATTCGRWRSAP